jgi:glycosyltransferase involved in cell wall biosynthesis
MKLSVVIPSYKDPLLIKTIDSLLENSELGDQIEIIATLDGYWPTFDLKQDPRVRYVHLGGNRGMREAINAAIDVARGEFLMRTDEHCSFGKGFDKILTSQTKDNWIVTPRRYFLDVVKWEIMDMPPVDFMKLKIVNVSPGVRKFSGVAARGDDNQPIQESMAMQGSCWLMKRSWWDKIIGRLQNKGYGPHYQDSHEMVFKTWQAGGKLMVNKNTWHAHKHRDFPRTHNNGTPENPTNNEACWAYSLKVWKDYYDKEIKPKWGI